MQRHLHFLCYKRLYYCSENVLNSYIKGKLDIDFRKNPVEMYRNSCSYCFLFTRKFFMSHSVIVWFCLYAEVLIQLLCFCLRERIKYTFVNDNTIHFTSCFRSTSWFLENIDCEVSWLSV